LSSALPRTAREEGSSVIRRPSGARHRPRLADPPRRHRRRSRGRSGSRSTSPTVARLRTPVRRARASVILGAVNRRVLDAPPNERRSADDRAVDLIRQRCSDTPTWCWRGGGSVDQWARPA
jgi:hypothetical protein